MQWKWANAEKFLPH